MIAELPDAWNAVFNVLLQWPVAWASPAEVAGALGRGEPETTDLLCDLDVAGWLTVWDSESGPRVTLSALAAERLGARLVEVGTGEVPRWARAGDPEPPAPRAKHVCRGARAGSLEFVVDPAPPPDAAAERSERSVARALSAPAAAPARADDLPRPSVLVGIGLTPWPGPKEAGAAGCPACGGKALGPAAYCLYCDRWGLDRLLPVTPGGAAPAPPAPRARPEPDRAAREQQASHHRARRKARRRKRQAARVEAARVQKTDPRPPEPKAPPAPAPAVDFTRPPRSGPVAAPTKAAP